MLEWVLILTVIVIVVGIAVDWRRRPSPPMSLGAAREETDLREPPRIERYSRPPSRWTGPTHLTEEDSQGFLQVWGSVQERFEDDPKAAVVYADLLISGLLQIAGCQTHAEGRSEILLHEKFSAAHTIAFESTQRGVAPDALRRAMSLYAAVFDELFRELRVPAARDAGTVAHKIFPLGR
jgi:hypothetical protein